MLSLKIINHVPFEQLKDLYRKAEKSSLARRYLAILKLYEGKTVPQVAKELYITPQIVRKWVHRWNDFGQEGLKSKPQSGRPSILNEEEQSEMIQEVTDSPRNIGYDFSLWTLKAIVGHIKEKYQKEMTISGAQRMLKRNNLSRIVPRPMPVKGDPQKKRIFRK